MMTRNDRRGDTSEFDDREMMRADEIEDSLKSRGVSNKEAEDRSWGAVTQEKGGSDVRVSTRGRKNPVDYNDDMRQRRASHLQRSSAAKKGWETRRRRRVGS